MKLELRINRGAAKNLFDEQWEVSPLIVQADDIVSATISLEPGEKGGDFYLAVGGEPDVIAQAEKVNPGLPCDFEWRTKKNKTIKYERFFPLFNATMMGETKLWLANETNPFRREWDVYVQLDPDDPRPNLYDVMVRELLEKGFPHEVIDDFKGQMKHHGFSLDWQDGYASRESDELVLEELQKVVSEMRPLLEAICRAPRLDVVSGLRLLPIARAKKPDACLRRGIRHLGSRIGRNTLKQAGNLCIRARCKKIVPGKNVHAVLHMFLRDFVLRRSEIIRRHYETRPSRPRMWWKADGAMVLKEREIFASKAKLAKQVSDSVRGLLALPVFCDVQKQLTFFDVAPEEFTHTESYTMLHGIMLRFLRARFWWMGDEGDGWWKMPRLRLSADGSSRWERKYSMVYENWCHAHLILAFRELGYEGREQERPLPGCKGSCWSFRKDDIEVFLQHDVWAWHFDPNRPAAFVVVPGGSNLSTPDFAIVVKRRGRPEVEWFVADAKSDCELKCDMIEKRCKYARDLRWGWGSYKPSPLEDYDGKKPFASILFRSGPTGDNDAPADVEMPPPAIPAFSGDDHSHDKYGWAGANGVKIGKPKPPYHGHLRVNVVSIKKRPDIFREFVAGMIATACRHLSAYQKV